MQGILILIFSFIVVFFLSKFTQLKPLVNFKDKFEYIPILTANILADLLIIFITFSRILGSTKSWKILEEWYKKYRLSAMIADILIGVLYLLIARYIAYKINFKFNLFTFALLAVAIQLILDFSFYLLFISFPKGKNDMLDFFKIWAKHAELDALWGDSILVIVAIILSSILNKQSFDFNIFTLIFSIYLIPYILYMKD